MGANMKTKDAALARTTPTGTTPGRYQPTPDGLQHLLSRAVWEADEVRDDLRSYVSEAFGEPDGILVVDETGDRKRAPPVSGVQRQYTGTPVGSRTRRSLCI